MAPAPTVPPQRHLLSPLGKLLPKPLRDILSLIALCAPVAKGTNATNGETGVDILDWSVADGRELGRHRMDSQGQVVLRESKFRILSYTGTCAFWGIFLAFDAER